MDGFIHDSRSEEITDFIICAILNHGKVVFCFLHLKSHFSLLLFQSIEGSMITLSRGEWMGLPDLPFKEWLKQKRR